MRYESGYILTRTFTFKRLSKMIKLNPVQGKRGHDDEYTKNKRTVSAAGKTQDRDPGSLNRSRGDKERMRGDHGDAV